MPGSPESIIDYESNVPELNLGNATGIYNHEQAREAYLENEINGTYYSEQELMEGHEELQHDFHPTSSESDNERSERSDSESSADTESSESIRRSGWGSVLSTASSEAELSEAEFSEAEFSEAEIQRQNVLWRRTVQSGKAQSRYPFRGQTPHHYPIWGPKA